MNAIVQYLRSKGYNCVPDEFYSAIALWRKWYQGRVPEFHDYRQYNGKTRLRRSRRPLAMAKTVAEDWANLALNEKVEIMCGKKSTDKRVWGALNANKFRVRGNQLLEMAFAMGTGAFVERKDTDGAIKIDYIRADMIYPLSWDNLTITQCAFASETASGKERHVYLNLHLLENGKYVVENHMFRRTGEALTEIDLPPGVEAGSSTGSHTPLFQIIRPNIANNLDPDCPMGISVYANALPQLEGLDLVYDSYCNEFQLGRKRITVPMSMARVQMEQDGTVTPVFDDNDTEFFAVPAAEGQDNKIQEHNMEIRYQAHDAGIQTALNLLSFKCGMGKDRYNFQDGQVKTATEVVSEKSDLFQSLKKHELLLQDALTGLYTAVATLLGLGAPEVTVNFDDSIIEDSDTQRATDRQDVRDGLMAKWEYRMRWYGEDEKTARAMAAELDTGPELGFGGDS